MAKSKTYRFISLTMAFLIFFSSSGISMDAHFCQGNLKRVNLFGNAKSCSEVSQVSTCHGNATANICSADDTHDGCCNNKSFEFDLDFDSVEMFVQNISDTKVELAKAIVFGDFGYTLAYSKFNNYTNYFPPPLQQDILVLFQVFHL